MLTESVINSGVLAKVGLLVGWSLTRVIVPPSRLESKVIVSAPSASLDKAIASRKDKSPALKSPSFSSSRIETMNSCVIFVIQISF